MANVPLSTWTSIFATATLSPAVPEAVILPETIAPLAGEAITTVGALVSLGMG